MINDFLSTGGFGRPFFNQNIGVLLCIQSFLKNLIQESNFLKL